MEEDKYYNATSLQIFEYEWKTKISSMKIVVKQFNNIFENTLLVDYVRQVFKIEEALLELVTKLEDFAYTRTEVSNYWQVVRDKYESLDLLEASEVVEIIEKFNRKPPNITLV